MVPEDLQPGALGTIYDDVGSVNVQTEVSLMARRTDEARRTALYARRPPDSAKVVPRETALLESLSTDHGSHDSGAQEKEYMDQQAERRGHTLSNTRLSQSRISQSMGRMQIDSSVPENGSRAGSWDTQRTVRDWTRKADLEAMVSLPASSQCMGETNVVSQVGPRISQ